MTETISGDISGIPAESADKPVRKKRGRKPGQQPKERPVIPMEEFFDIEEVPEDERVDHKRRREERTEQQKGIDEVVRQNYERWKEMGCPANWADMPVIRWKVSPTFAEEAEFLLRKAASLYGRKLNFGQKEEITTENGPKVVLPFCVTARPPRKERPTNSDSTEN